MSRSFGSTMGLVVLLGLVGCGDPNAGALFADLQYATRCGISLGCPGPVDHDVCGFDGSDPCTDGSPEPSLSCSATEVEGATRTMTFSARHAGSDFSLQVQNLTVPFTGGAATGGACRVTVVEGENTYAGACGGSAPSEAQPCQITEVEFSDDMGNPTFSGNIFCQFLANQASPALQIEVTTVGMGTVASSTPARFRFANCEGLTCTPETCTTIMMTDE